jgi:hypothetical protein
MLLSSRRGRSPSQSPRARNKRPFASAFTVRYRATFPIHILFSQRVVERPCFLAHLPSYFSRRLLAVRDCSIP